ncbi:MAG: hypothetical protein ACREJO_00065 [Phycisphaerales bacterium]
MSKQERRTDSIKLYFDLANFKPTGLEKLSKQQLTDTALDIERLLRRGKLTEEQRQKLRSEYVVVLKRIDQMEGDG